MTPFDIKFDIKWTGLNKNQMTKFPPEVQRRIETIYFEGAKQWWKYAIKGWPPAVAHLLIHVEFKPIDGPGKVIARVDRANIRTVAVNGAVFPVEATMELDLADVEQLLENRPCFLDTVIHEIGHALGIGTLFDVKGGPQLVRSQGQGTQTEHFYVGSKGRAAFGALPGQSSGSGDVPLVQDGTNKAYHWTEKDLKFEIMSDWLDAPNATSKDTGISVISAVSIGALEDLGYEVEPQAARPLKP